MSILFLLFLRLCASVMVWLMLFIYLALLGSLGGVCYYKSVNNDFSDLPKELQDAKLLKGIAITLFCIGGLSLLIILCNCKKI